MGDLQNLIKEWAPSCGTAN